MKTFKAHGVREISLTKQEKIELTFEAEDFDAALEQANALAVAGEWQPQPREREFHTTRPRWFIKVADVKDSGKAFYPDDAANERKFFETMQEFGDRFVRFLEKWGELTAALKLADLLEDLRIERRLAEYTPDIEDDEDDGTNFWNAQYRERHAKWRAALIAKIEKGSGD